VPGVGSCCGGLRFAPTALRCSVRGRAAELTALRSVQTDAASQMWMRAARADLGPPLLIATQIATTGHRLPRNHRLFFSTKTKTGSAKRGSLSGGALADSTCALGSLTANNRERIAGLIRSSADAYEGPRQGRAAMLRGSFVHGRSPGSAAIGPGAFATRMCEAIGANAARKCTELLTTSSFICAGSMPR
jgi:hypothetical protein